MNSYIDIIKSYLSEHRTCYGGCGAESLTGMLCYWYRHFNPINSDEIRDNFIKLEDAMAALTFQQRERIDAVTTELCIQHEDRAFEEGFRVGAGLVLELLEERPS